MAPAAPRAGLPAALRPVARAALCLLAAGAPLWALAQDGQPADAALALRPIGRLGERLPDAPAPTFLLGDALRGTAGLEAVIDGHAELRRPGLVIKGDRVHYDEASAIADAAGNLRVNARGDRYGGSRARLQTDAFEGYLLDPTYEFLANGVHGRAARIDFHDADTSTTWQASYTSCTRAEAGGGTPGWLLRADRLDIDRQEGIGRASGAVLELEGVPLLPLPALSFALDGRRKSGWLPPTVGLDSTSGLNLALPYYWNIAPQRDATFTPHLMLRRGLDVAAEFRYLEPDYQGQASAHYMPADRLRNRQRWGYFARHSGTIRTGWEPVGALGLDVSLNRVSDDNHWRDFSGRAASSAARLLANEASLQWARGALSVVARASKWQTLQPDDVAAIIPPYDRLPQITARWARTNDRGFDYAIEADHTRFMADRRIVGQPNAQRSFVHAQLARPFVRPWGFFTPRLQLHATRYAFDAPIATGATSAGRTVPTLSLDAGLVFERSAGYFGRTFTQTLEPRLMYVRTPYRNQAALPNYDSGAYDFNFATIWAENAFAGHDRIADNHLVTAGVTSRLLNPASGAEAVRLAFAQRYRFDAQRVALPGAATAGADRGWSDMMLGAGINWAQHWAFDTVLQYNPDTRRTTRATWQARYSPGPYRTVSLAYRHQRTYNTQYLDLGWQWPLSAAALSQARAAASLPEPGRSGGSGGHCGGAGRWYGVGRLNYSLKESRLVDGVLGVELDRGCWIGRLVLEKTSNSITSSTKRLMFQLEFVGLSRVGSNPIAALRNHVPRYRPLGQDGSAAAPSRFTQYD